jgi:hypothetical protein
MHRGYHVLAIPTWERKVRVLLVWLTALLFGRDIASLESTQHPRAAFTGRDDPASSPDFERLTVWHSSGNRQGASEQGSKIDQWGPKHQTTP